MSSLWLTLSTKRHTTGVRRQRRKGCKWTMCAKLQRQTPPDSLCVRPLSLLRTCGASESTGESTGEFAEKVTSCRSHLRSHSTSGWLWRATKSIFTSRQCERWCNPLWHFLVTFAHTLGRRGSPKSFQTIQSSQLEVDWLPVLATHRVQIADGNCQRKIS